MDDSPLALETDCLPYPIFKKIIKPVIGALMSEQHMEVEGDTNDQLDEESLLPQDGSLGHRQQYFSVQIHYSYAGTEEWATYFSMGIATDAQKAPLVEEI